MWRVAQFDTLRLRHGCERQVSTSDLFHYNLQLKDATWQNEPNSVVLYARRGGAARVRDLFEQARRAAPSS